MSSKVYITLTDEGDYAVMKQDEAGAVLIDVVSTHAEALAVRAANLPEPVVECHWENGVNYDNP